MLIRLILYEEKQQKQKPNKKDKKQVRKGTLPLLASGVGGLETKSILKDPHFCAQCFNKVQESEKM
jgi:hypothetical protein